MRLENLSATKIDGQLQQLNVYAGKVLLIVNVASKCGFTKQYADLEMLQQEFGAQGFTVLGFPCDQFGHQEPGDEAQIAKFCETQFKISFPMFAKIAVNGPEASPVFEWLKQEKAGLLGTESIKWNFTKFLVGRDQRVIDRYAPTTRPTELRGDIQQALSLPYTSADK
ncbi:glutathione peroxidase [Alcaligenaceae bacterium LF4-65]|jgi:glutathione peroxidase|uniref:Glutathione peroxidase n=1 Tax=Zwartia hollandica TaxID=324606 RepID=A0A953N6Z2_9BURK|nr:glutathione peroxidase [Zwartia hollandica]MBZ1349183.1 glutathione peroxidase [Zwartia hollandica]